MPAVKMGQSDNPSHKQQPRGMTGQKQKPELQTKAARGGVSSARGNQGHLRFWSGEDILIKLHPHSVSLPFSTLFIFFLFYCYF